MRTLVIGGTGPSGPHIVDGLLGRGHAVTVLHGGKHEVTFPPEVEHLHGDPHFEESLDAVLGGRIFDVVLATYGRLRVVSEVFRGRTGHLIGVGSASGASPDPSDPQWGRLGQPVSVEEGTDLVVTDASRRLSHRIAEARRTLFRVAAEGGYRATYLGYPLIYGARQPAPVDWCIVRRALDKRERFIVADGGLKVESRMYAENAAHAVLLVIDQPEVAAGKTYYLSDDRLFSMRQRIDYLAWCVGHRFELVDMPYELAAPCHVLWRHERGHRIRSNRLIREELGYRDVVHPEQGMRAAAVWLRDHAPVPGGEEETQLGDPFDYDGEDRIVGQWTDMLRSAAIDVSLRGHPAPGHQYRHPRQPGDDWKPIDARAGDRHEAQVPTEGRA
jgi:nucleoside-diphosphate-sugar epimerase